MRKNDGAKLIKEVAGKNGVTEEEVRSEMKSAILAAYMNRETREKWNETFGEGVLPTPEEFIIIMAEKIKK